MGTEDGWQAVDDAWARRAWGEVVTALESLDDAGSLGPPDLELLGRASYLVGRDQQSVDALARAHRGHLDSGDVPDAVRCAFWLGLLLVQRGDHAQGSGWIARAARLVDGLPADAVERDYLRLPGALQALGAGDAVAARAGFAAALEAGTRAGDPDLTTLGLLGSGQAAVLDDDVDEALGHLDEAMVAVLAEEVSPIVAGIVYCGVIAACRDLLELRRAREWTQALSVWCEAQPDLVPYRGQCLVHRAQVLQLSGRWEEALDEVVDARGAFGRAGDQVAVGLAWYEQGELHRLRGETDRAERAYEQAGRAGHAPQPGLALLRLVEGRPDLAVDALRGVVATASGDLERGRVLPALVEALLAAGAVADARTTADELAELARLLHVDWVRATSERATGSVLLAEGRPTAALSHLQRACGVWRTLGVPHEVASTRVLAARAYRAVGDLDTARIEAEAARRTAAELGAVPLAARLDELVDTEGTVAPGGLTEREVEVLAEVATGKTNRQVAEVLFISDKTVARHLSNIYTKLGLPSRAAATAWAYEHEVVGSSG